MKISELTQISSIQRNILIPLSIGGQNMSITLGQIIDAVSQDVVPFDNLTDNTSNVFIAIGSNTVTLGGVIFDTVSNNFYRAISQITNVAGQNVVSYTYYQYFDTHDSYYNNNGNIRTDCLFVASDGRLYKFNGTTLISAGVTEAQAKQIRLSTPIEVASEEEMEQRIAAGEYEDGQLYYIAEDE